MKRKIFTKSILIAFFALTIGMSAFAQTSFFEYTGATETYTVPADVHFVQITTVGASGGQGQHTSSGVPGTGTSIQGTFEVTPGQVLVVLVGEEGEGAQYVGGGGGGSFVWEQNTFNLLSAAGGGGGGGSTDGGDTFVDGIDASTGLNGTNGAGFSDGQGIDGNGGVIPTTEDYASGGTGWYTNGADGVVYSCDNNSTGGETPLTGGAGGNGGGNDAAAADGGFGGGGGGNGRCGAVGGGGGGGYSGGGAGGEIISGDFNGGGGGGSFNGGTSQVNIEGYNSGNGQVVISVITGVDVETLDGLNLVVFPNPTQDEVQIQVEGSFKYELTNINGAVILKGTGVNSEFISLRNNATGLYFLNITTNNESKTVKVLKN